MSDDTRPDAGDPTPDTPRPAMPEAPGTTPGAADAMEAPGTTTPGAATPPSTGGSQGAWGPPGAAPGGLAATPTPTAGASDSRQMAMFAHLSAILTSFIGLPFLGPLVMWLVKKDQDPYVGEHAREALNFSITFSVVSYIGVVVGTILSFILIGIPILLAVGLYVIAALVLAIVAGIKANNGEHYRYPLSFRLVR